MFSGHGPLLREKFESPSALFHRGQVHDVAARGRSEKEEGVRKIHQAKALNCFYSCKSFPLRHMLTFQRIPSMCVNDIIWEHREVIWGTNLHRPPCDPGRRL